MRPKQRTAKLGGKVMPQTQVISVLLMRGVVSYSAFSCPTFMIHFGGNGVRRGSGSQHIQYETFIITFHGKIHFPMIFRRPMPVQNVLTVSMPVKLNCLPEFINF